MEGFIANGEEWMRPLNVFRDHLVEYRDKEGMRKSVRRDGTKGHGPFTHEARRQILRELLETEQQVSWKLISDEELLSIQTIWSTEFDYTHRAAVELAAEFGRKLGTAVFHETNIRSHDQLLEKAALEVDLPPELLKSVLDLVRQRSASLSVYGAKSGLERELENILMLASNQAEHAAP